MKHLNSILTLLFIIIFTIAFPKSSFSAPVKISQLSLIGDLTDLAKDVNDMLNSKNQIKRKKHRHDDDDDGWHNDDDDDGNDIPLDGGLSFLTVAGAGLGIKKVVEHRNKNKDNK